MRPEALSLCLEKGMTDFRSQKTCLAACTQAVKKKLCQVVQKLYGKGSAYSLLIAFIILSRCGYESCTLLLLWTLGSAELLQQKSLWTCWLMIPNHNSMGHNRTQKWNYEVHSGGYRLYRLVYAIVVQVWLETWHRGQLELLYNTWK